MVNAADRLPAVFTDRARDPMLTNTDGLNGFRLWDQKGDPKLIPGPH
jgi:hypothetical protein